MIHWLTPVQVTAIHHQLISDHGGPEGIRDHGLLESALARPRNLHAYEKADLYHVAAAYGFGICSNHPFVDGNKRTSLMTIYTFLGINGFELVATEEDAVYTIMQLAQGDLSEEDLAIWIKKNTSAWKKK